MKRKLKSTQGETLVEVLAAILIGALSVALLFSAVMASVNMDRTARETDSKYKQVLDAAEGQTTEFVPLVPPAADRKVTVANGSSEAKVDVTFYGGDGALSYALNTTP